MAVPGSDLPRGDFLDGLLRSSGASFVGAVALALVELGLAVLLLTPRHLISLPPRILMKSARDDYARTTLLSYRLKYRNRNPLTVAYLGASTAQRALFDSIAPGPIEASLRKQVGERVEFVPLIAAGETVEETLLLVRHLPERFRGIVAMVVFEDKDDERNKKIAYARHGEIEERLPFDALPGEPPRLGFDDKPIRRSGVFFFDHLGFFAARRISFLQPLPMWAPFPRGGPSRPTPPENGNELRTYKTRYLETPMALLTNHAGTLADIVKTAQERGAQVVLVEAPSNPRYQALKGDRHGEYLEKIADFAAEHGAEYWDINPEVGAQRKDFEDAVHLGARKRRLKFQEVLCGRLATKLREIATAPGEAEAAPEAE